MNLLRYIVVVLNIVLFAMGMMVFKIGLVLRTDYITALALLRAPLGLVGVALGLLILILATMGILGALTLRAFLLYAYVVFAILLITMEVAMLALTIVARKYHSQENADYTDKLETIFKKTEIYDRYRDNPRMWDDIHKRYQCCGVLGRTALRLGILDTTALTSCCTNYKNVYESSTVCLSKHNVGCIPHIIKELDVDYYPTLVALILSMIIQVVSGVLTFLLEED